VRDRFGIDWNQYPRKPFGTGEELGRRMFFRHVASATAGYFLLPGRPMETVARAAAPAIGTAKNCIFVLLSGAMSHVDTWDLKEGAWLPARFNPTSYGDLRWPQGLMPRLAEQLDSLAIVRSMYAWAGVHDLMRRWVQIGRNPASPSSNVSPHIGSVVSMELGAQSSDPTLPAFVALNANPDAGSGFLAPENAPFVVTAGGALPNTAHPVGAARFDQRYGLLQELDAETRATADFGPGAAETAAWNARARLLMYNAGVNNAFTTQAADRTRYGNTGFGNACLTARQLLKSNLGVRFIQITFGGWDHHTNIYANNANLSLLAPQLDQGLAELIADLRADRLFDSTLIVAQGEFGRTVGPLNSSAGRDHHQQQSVLFAGGGVRGRTVIGSTDSLGRRTAEPGWSRNRDIRNEDIEATIYSALGIDYAKLLRDPLGRAFEYVPGTLDGDL